MPTINYELVIENLERDTSDNWFVEPAMLAFPDLQKLSKQEAIKFFKKMKEKENNGNNGNGNNGNNGKGNQ